MENKPRGIPVELGLRNDYYRIVIPHIHTDILRLVVITDPQKIWLDAKLLVWIEEYDAGRDTAHRDEVDIEDRRSTDQEIQDYLNPILDTLEIWTPLSNDDRLTFHLYEAVTSYSKIEVPSYAPNIIVDKQVPGGATGHAIDPENPNAGKLPVGAQSVIWIGHLITDPVNPNPDPVLVGNSNSIKGELEFPSSWVGKQCNVQAYYIDVHKNKSKVSKVVLVNVI